MDTDLRLFVWNRDKGICQICGRKLTEDLDHLTSEDSKQFKPANLRLRIGHIHHKDMNWENDAPNNLVLLCEDCHVKTHLQAGKTSPPRSRRAAAEEARIKRQKRQADEWRRNYYAMKKTPARKRKTKCNKGS